MKCLIGFESKEGLSASLGMLKSLGPSQLQTEILHVADCIKSYPGYGLVPQAQVPGTLVSALESSSKELMAWAEGYAAAEGIECNAKLLWGSVSQSLLKEASEVGADLIAIHRRSMTGLERFFLGSVSQALLLGSRQSVLVTKGQAAPAKNLSVVFGIDHSQYSYKCVEQFLRFGMTGVKRLTLVSAFEVQADGELEPNAPYLAIRREAEGLQTELAEKNKVFCERFAALGIESSSREVEGRPEKVLHDSMQDTQADLMIVGAQGHGFIERLLIGSTSLQQVAVETYPVLVVRI
jgi:nucleotide-binding universal stress UspA family protein